MNILKLELKFDFKRFIFWSVGIFILILAGMTKFIGISDPEASADMTQLLEAFPKIILAMMGMANVDIQSLGGYFFIVQYYVVLCVIIYSIHLGTNAVLREDFDKTYEFVFTKPRKRSFILFMKLLSSFMYLFVFSLFNMAFSFGALKILNIENSIGRTIILCSIAAFLIGFVFMAFAACVSALAKKSENGTRISYLCFFIVFVLGMIFDILKNGSFVKPFTPIKYFEGSDLIKGNLDPVYVLVCFVLILIFLFATFREFERKDLNPS